MEAKSLVRTFPEVARFWGLIVFLSCSCWRKKNAVKMRVHETKNPCNHGNGDETSQSFPFGQSSRRTPPKNGGFQTR